MCRPGTLLSDISFNHDVIIEILQSLFDLTILIIPNL